MKDESMLLLHLINENKTLNEISEILDLSNKQLFTRLSLLKNTGYLLDRKYFANGDIRYSIANPIFPSNTNSNELNIETPKNIKKIRLLITSDLHLASHKENLKAVNAMMEYCIKKGIHIIVNAGDFFQGIYSDKSNTAKITDAFEQIQYGLKNYPSDKNIFTITCLGNHDASFWLENGIDIKTVINDRRHDIVALGYGIGYININDNRIALTHPIDRCNFQMPLIRECFNIIGHSHAFKVYENTLHKQFTLYAPTLSNVEVTSNPTPIPSIIDTELTLTELGIQHEHFQQFIFVNDSFIKIGEIDYNMSISKKTKNRQQEVSVLKPKLPSSIEELTQKIEAKKIMNEQNVEEEIDLSSDLGKAIMEAINETSNETLIPNNKYQGMSQIEKFSARFGNNSPYTRTLKP